MTNAPTIYGHPSALGNLPDDMEYVKEAVLAWRGWPFDFLSPPWVFNPFHMWTVDLLHHGVRRVLSYEADTEQEHRWQHPESLLCGPSIKYLHGDCEDFALCFAGLAHRALGIGPADIFVTVMHLPNEDAVSFPKGYDPAHTHRVKAIVTPMIHAVCVIRTEGGNKVLDQRAIEVTDDTPDADIAPIFSINLNGEVFWHSPPARKETA